MITKLYNLFSGEELKIAEKIQQRRLQMLVHSYIYYDLNNNIVSDSQWAEWAVELKNLQEQYPEIEQRVPYRQGFEDWDASSGAFLPYRSPDIIANACYLMKIPVVGSLDKPPVKKQQTAKKRLF
jgi:hypothetical protein